MRGFCFSVSIHLSTVYHWCEWEIPCSCSGGSQSPAIAEYFASSILLRSHNWYSPDHSVRIRFISLTINKLEQQQKRKEIPRVHLTCCLLWPRTFVIVSLILTLNTLRCSLRPEDWKLKLRFTVWCDLRYCYYKTPGPDFGHGFISSRSKWWFGTQLLHWGDGRFVFFYIAWRQNRTRIVQAHEFLAVPDDRLLTSHWTKSRLCDFAV